MNRTYIGAVLVILFGILVSPQAMAVQRTAIYRLDRYALSECFDKLLAMAKTAEVSNELQCSVEIAGPLDPETFQKYLNVDTLEIDSDWEPPDGFYVHAVLRADLQSLKIKLKAMAHGDIQERHVLALREKFMARVGTPLQIDYIELPHGR